MRNFLANCSPRAADRCQSLVLAEPHKLEGVIEVSRERFEELVGEALDQIPRDLAKNMDNVVVLVEDDSPNGGLLGLYEGYDLTRRGWDYSGVLPDRIFIYRNPILRICHTEAEVIDEITTTVIHEVAHHFGIDDHRLHQLGWG